MTVQAELRAVYYRLAVSYGISGCLAVLLGSEADGVTAAVWFVAAVVFLVRVVGTLATLDGLDR